MIDIFSLTTNKLIEKLKEGEISSVEVCTLYIERIEKFEKDVKAWEFFDKFDKPFLCTFADNDPVTAGIEKQFFARIPGTKGLPHDTIKKGGHFVQENAPEQVSQAIINLIHST